MRPYFCHSKGIWEGLPEPETKSDIIACKLFDDDENEYPAIIGIETNDFEVTVTSIDCCVPEGVKLNNPKEDITNALREEGYKSQEIIFN